MVSFQVTSGQSDYLKHDAAIFVAPSANSTHNISIAANEDYLVFKTTKDAHIYVMAVCALNHKYNSADFTCDPCSDIKKSFGIQSESCELCADLTYPETDTVMTY